MLDPIPCPIRENPPMLSQFGPKLENLMMILCKAFNYSQLTIVNFPLKKYSRPICPPKLRSPIFCDVFCDGHVHKHQTQSCILKKLKKKKKKKLWITSVCLNFKYSNLSHCKKSWLRKYLLHCHLQIFMQKRVFKKKKNNNNSGYF